MLNPLGPLYTFEFVLLLGCAALYFKLAELDPHASPMLWAGMSVLVFFVTWRWLGWGLLGDVVGQIALLGGITAVRVLRERSRP
jgi:hypothetical protein